MNESDGTKNELVEMLETIKANKADEALSFVKAGISSLPIPCFGVVAEILYTFIPNQRMDRVAKFIEILANKVQEHEVLLFKENKFAVDVLEESVLQASKALSEERNSYLATITYDSLECDEQGHNFQKLVLFTLSELTDFEVSLLESSYNSTFNNAIFKLQPPNVTQGQYDSFSTSERNMYEDSKAAYGATVQKFIRLNLVNEPEDFFYLQETAEDIKELQRLLIEERKRQRNYEVSKFGESLLRAIGIIGKEDNGLD